MNQPKRAYQTVLFIDAGVSDAGQLIAGAADDVLVVQLAAGGDGVEQIADVLRHYEGLDSIQIVAHGAAGRLQLGDAQLDAGRLDHYAAALKQWGGALRDGGDLLIYGCDVGQGAQGQAFVDALALASGADVAASTDITGGSALGANWLLERSSGSIEATSALDAQARMEYAHALGLVNGGSNGTITFNTASDVTLLNATGLVAGAVVHADNILGLGLDLYARSTNGGGVTVLNANGTSLLGIPLTDDRLTVNGSLLSPVSYVDLRANSGVFDLVSLSLGSGNLVGNLLGFVVYTVYALDANYQPTGVGVSLLSLVVNEYGLLNFASMADFKGIYGVRIVNPLGFEVGIDDLTIANARPANTVTSAAYNAGTGVLTVTATGIHAGDAIDPGKFTISGQGGATYTLTSPTVSAASGTSVSVTLNAADKLAIGGILNKNGASGVDGTSFNLAAADNWDGNLSGGQDLTGNPISVSNVQLPTITSASYNATTHVLTVTGSNLVGVTGAANDITVAKLSLKGEGGVSRVLGTTGNVDVASATSFSVTLSGADIAAVEALLNKSGTQSAGGTTYQLSAGDDWNSVIGNTSIAVSGALVVVGNVANSAPTITGAAAAGVGDNATLQPFSGVTVADVNGDNVSMAISYNGANGTLSGGGLSGAAGSYTLSAATPAALTAQLKALVFTPTSNQAAVGVGIGTTFTLVATDSNGQAGAANTATVITATSVNDAPALGGTAAAQGMAAGATLRPFSGVTLSDPDVGASVIVTVTPDSAAKGAFTPASLSASGFTTVDGGVTYTHAAAAPGAAQAALQALVFQSAAGVNATTTFTVGINDGSVIVSNSATTVVSATSSGTTALTVAFSNDSGISATDLVTKVAAQTISGTLSAGLAAGETVEVSLDNGATWSAAAASIGGSTWQLAGQTLSGAGTLQVRVSNVGGSSTPLSASYALDTTAPATTSAGVAFSADTGASGSDLITRTAAQTISGTLGANLAADEHVEVSLNNGATWTTASASVGGNAWTLAGQTISGSNTLQVRVVDAAGNAGAAVGAAYALDTAAPTVSLSSNVGTLKSGETATITLTFSEAPADLVLSDLNAVGGTLGNLAASANPRIYTVEFTPNAGLSGLLGGVSLAAGSYTDAAGNNGGGASSAAISITTLGPSLVITSDAATLKSGETANITFTFTSPPSGFTAGDISVSGGTLSGLANAGGGVYTALFTPGANVSASASITVAGGSYTDGVGNQGGGGVTPLIQVDTRAPTLAITSDLSALHIGDTATVTFTFSEQPLGFAAGDITTTGGTLSGLAVSANPLVYTAVFTPDAGVASGAAGISVAGAGYTDVLGNSGNAGVTPSISIDTLAPAVTAATVAFSADTGASNTDLVTRTATQTVSGTLSTALAAGEVVQVSLDNGGTWVNANGGTGATSWTLGGRTLVGSDTLQVRVSDAAGNHGAAFSAAYVLDTTAPTATVAGDVAALRAGESANLTFTFSEAPVNFSTASLNVSGGVVAGLAATADPLVYTAVFTPTAGQSGINASVGVKAAGYADQAGNNGQASAALPIAVNTAVPSLVITSSAAALKSGETAQINFTFSLPPTGFTAADISVANGALTGLAVTANPLVYTALFTPAAGLASGTGTISVAGGAYGDAFGNSGSGGSAPGISIDTLAPTVAISSSTAAVKAGETAVITFTFSEPPLGFTAGDVVTTGGALSGLAGSANPLVYTALFTPAAGLQNAAASITIAGGAFVDAAGNSATASATPPLAIDTLPPAAVANSVLFSADTGSSSTDLVTNTAAQTISGTLATALGAGETVEVSLDNGASWTAATAGAGNSWSLAGQTLVGSDTLQVRVSDAAGNHGAAYAAAYVLDASAPTVGVSSSAAALKAGDSATITITFSEAPVGFTVGDLSVASGTLSGFAASANPLVYTVLFTPAAGVDGGSGSVAVTAGGYTDAAGNAGAGVTLQAITVDTLAPSTSGASVVFSADSGAADLATNVAAQNLSGTLSANLLAGETVEVSLNHGASWTAASAGAAAWSLAGQTLSPGAGQQVQLRVSDAAGNHGAVYSAAYTLDQGAPTLQITSSKAVLNSADTPLITFTFSEAPAGFSAASVSAGGGVLSGFAATANPLVYTAVFTPTAGQAAGTGTVSVAAGAYTDGAGNNGLAAAVAAMSYATVAPGLAITSDTGALKSGETAAISFKFSTAPLNFAAGDIVVSGGTLSGFGATADPLVYSAVFTPAAGVAHGTAAISVASGLFTDTLGNAGVGGSMTPISVDTLAPTLAIASSAASLNGSGTALVSFTFSEAPAAFSLGDISASNGSLGNLVQTANPLVYTAVFTPAANVAAGSAVITVAAGAYADLAGNGGGTGTSPSIAIDTLAPSLATGSVLFSADTGSSGTDLITRTAAQTIAGTLSGGVLAAGDVVQVSLNNGATWVNANAAAGGSSWALTGQTLGGAGILQVRVSDSAGNPGAASSHAYQFDNAAPTVAIASDAASLRAGQSAIISFTFSEAPAGFVLGDLIASGGTLSGFAATANPLVYTVVLTPTPGFGGSASVTLGNGLYSDVAGNSGTGGASPSISIDTLAPTLSIVASSSALKAGETATVTFTFSDAPAGFAAGDVSATNGVLSGLAATADPLVYTATFTPAAGTAGASAVISVAGGLYTDAAGNAGPAASSGAIAVDTLAPTTSGASFAFSVDHGASNTDLVTNAASQVVTGTLDAPLAAGEQVQVSLNNGVTWLNAVATGPAQWALTPQLLGGSGTLQVRVADAAGNTGPAYSAPYVLDLVAPSMTVTSSASALKAGEAATLTFTFSETPNNFTQADLVAVNGTLGGFTATADPRVYTVLLTPSAGLGGGAAGVTLAAGLYTDAAGNAGAAVSSPLITVDTAAPALQIDSSAASLRIGELATITFTFSEAPLGFGVGDIAVGGGTLSGFGLTANPLVYTAIFTPTPGVAGGSATIDVAGGSYLDAAGNAGLAAAVTPIAFSTLAPSTGGATVGFSDDTGVSATDLVTSGALQTISGTVDANLAAGEIVEVSLDNGASWLTAASAPGANGWALAPQVLTASGVLQVRVTDAAGNHGAATSAAYVLDMAPAGVVITSNAATLKAGESATLTFSFSEAPQDFQAADIAVTGGAISGLAATANPRVYTAVFTPTPGYSGVAGVALAAGAFADTAGNLSAGAGGPSLGIDAQPPTLTITSSSAALKAGDTALISFTFSEAPLGFAVGDVTVSGGTLSGFTVTANPLVYTAVFTPAAGAAGGSAGISVAPSVYGDAAGNSGGAGATPAISIDTLAPAAAGSGAPAFSSDTGASGTDLVTAVAAQTVSGALSAPLAAGDVVQVSFDDGANWQTAVATVGGSSWSLAHTLAGSGVLRVRVADAAGNHGAETATPYALDQGVPTVAVSSDMATANGVTPATITFTFSEAPAGFGAGDVAVTGGVLGAITATADPLVFTASFTPTPGVASGAATIAVTGAYADAAGNSGAAGAIPALAIDTVAPLVTAGGAQFSSDGGASPADLVSNNPSQTLSGTLSAPPAAGDVVQVSLDNGQAWNTASVSGATWTLAGMTLSGSGTLVVRVADAAGNAGVAYTAPYTIDTQAPTVAISSNLGALAVGQSAIITLTLSDPAALTLADIAVSGGTLSNFSGGGTTYTVKLTPPANSVTPLTVSVAGHLFTDAAGNSSVAATPLMLAVDTVPAPETSTLVDGVEIRTQTGTDARTGLATRTVSVPVITSSRPEDASTAHADLADIPLGVAANAQGAGTGLTVSLPVGAGFVASGPASLVSGATARTDLIGRIDDHTATGQATRAAMQGQALRFLDSLDDGVQLQQGTLTLNSAAGGRASIIVDGGAPGNGAGLPDSAIALVIDARLLSQGTGILLDDIDFAAIVGAATVHGGAGSNFVIGDGEAQHIVLTTGGDNDTIYGNAGNDILGSAAGRDQLDGGDGRDILFGGGGDDVLAGGADDDVLQGGRSDSGQWQFYLTADGRVVGRHQMALTDAALTETVGAAELNAGIGKLAFATAGAAHLQELSLLYHAAFDRAPDLGGLSFWSTSGLTVQQLAAGFLVAPEAANGILALNNHDYVARLLQNTLGAAAGEAALAPWIARLEAAPGDMAERAGVLMDIALAAGHRALWVTADGVALGGELLAQEQGWIAASGDDRLEGGPGSDLLVGGDGFDTVVYNGAAAGYSLALGRGGELMIVEPDGARDTIRQIERGEFGGVALDLSFTQAAAGTLQQIGMLYNLTLDRAGDLSGFRHWLDSGLQGVALARGFTESVEFQQRYGGIDDAAFVRLMYQNTMQQDPGAATVQQWDAYLDTHSRADLVALLSTDATLVGSQFGTDGMSLIGSL